VLNQNLVHAIVGCKDPDRISARLGVNLALTRRHDSILFRRAVSPRAAAQGGQPTAPSVLESTSPAIPA
jgi:hypothetical protein